MCILKFYCFLLTIAHSTPGGCGCQVEVTKFEDLEETHAEVRLKQSLWKSQQDWEADYQLWLTVSWGFDSWSIIEPL